MAADPNHLVECGVECVAASTIEWQLELGGPIVVEVCDRHSDECEALKLIIGMAAVSSPLAVARIVSGLSPCHSDGARA
jgi:hypothetical protein